MNDELNLLTVPERKSSTSKRDVRILRTIAIISLFLVSALSIVLFLLITFSPLPQIKMQENSAIVNLSQLKTKIAKFSLINDRLQAISRILSSRLPYNSALDFLKEQLPRGSTIDGIKISGKAVSVTVSSNSLETLDTLLNILTKESQHKRIFQSVTLANIVYNEPLKRYEADISLSLL